MRYGDLMERSVPLDSPLIVGGAGGVGTVLRYQPAPPCAVLWIVLPQVAVVVVVVVVEGCRGVPRTRERAAACHPGLARPWIADLQTVP